MDPETGYVLPLTGQKLTLLIGSACYESLIDAMWSMRLDWQKIREGFKKKN